MSLFDSLVIIFRMNLFMNILSKAYLESYEIRNIIYKIVQRLLKCMNCTMVTLGDRSWKVNISRSSRNRPNSGNRLFNYFYKDKGEYFES